MHTNNVENNYIVQALEFLLFWYSRPSIILSEEFLSVESELYMLLERKWNHDYSTCN